MKTRNAVITTFFLTFISVVLLARLVNDTSDESRQSITFSSKKLEKILTEKKIDKFEISAYLTAVDSEGSSIKINLSDDAPPPGEGEIEVDKPKAPGIKEKIDHEIRALFAATRCVSTQDVYIHPNITPPGNTCYQVGMYGGFSIGGQWIPYHCHCFNPWY